MISMVLCRLQEFLLERLAPVPDINPQKPDGIGAELDKLLGAAAWGMTILAAIGLLAIGARWLIGIDDHRTSGEDAKRLAKWAAGFVLMLASGPFVNWLQ